MNNESSFNSTYIKNKENHNKMLKEIQRLKSSNLNNYTNIDNTSNISINTENISNNKRINEENEIKQRTQNRKLDEKYLSIKKSHNIDHAESEAEKFISNLRDNAEYNRWSLKLIQKWLLNFYKGKYNYIYISKAYSLYMNISLLILL